MKTYIDFNTEKRKNAANDIEKDFVKLMINSVYGKKSQNLYKEFYRWKDLFDFSNYSKDSIFHDDTNKKVIGIMKNEQSEVIIIEFIGLKAKMYSIRKIDGSESSTAKGVNIATEFNEFKDVLFKKNYQA